ncbi:MAG TPA: insulinase family protein [Chitinophagaceae bacterium]|jgi:predicted Zn-dependent peptidase
MLKRLLLLLPVIALLQQANAQNWKTAKEGGYTYSYVPGDPMHARFYTLKNGMTVILSVNKSAPRISTLIGTRAGSNNDPAEHTGLAHYLEHLLFKGTDRYGSLDWNKEKPYIDQIENLYAKYNTQSNPTERKMTYHEIDSISGVTAQYAIPNEFDKMMTAIGAQGTNAHTTTEETVYEEDIPANEIDRFLAIEAERFRYPVFRLFHTELEAVYEEKNRGLDNDGQKVYYALLDGLFPHTNYGQQTTIGTIADLKNPSLKAIRQFYNTWYVSNNMVVVMAGDLEPSSTIRKIDAAFSYMQPKGLIEYQPAAETPIKAPVIRHVYGPEPESLNIAFRMPGVNDQHSQVLLEVLADLLSNGKAGLMDIDLNQQQKLQSAGAGNNTYRLYGMLQLQGKAKPGQSLEEVRDLLLGELEKIRRGDFDASLIKAVVANQKLNELESMKDNDFRATNLLHEFTLDRGRYWPQSVAFKDNMLKVTKQQVMDFARAWTGNNYVIIYKHTGKDPDSSKVEKPAITPITINKTEQSAFLKRVESMLVSPIQPAWVNYEKVIKRDRTGVTPMLYVHNPDNGLFSLTYRFEGLGSNGDKRLPIAAEYMSLLGTKSKNAAAISRAFYDIACDYQVSVNGDETDITIGGLQENFTKAVSLLYDLLAHCQPDEAALADYKTRLIKARQDAKLDKENISHALMSYAMYGADNPFNRQLSAKELEALSAKELSGMLRGLMHYQHQVCYYGPMSLQSLKTAIHSPDKLLAVKPAADFKKIDQTENRVLFADYNMVQAEVYWIRNTTPYEPNQSATVNVFNNYFGTSMSSVVFQTIRESKALAYATYNQYAAPDKKGGRYTNIAYVGAQADKLPEAVGAMNQLLDSLPENAQLLAASKTSLRQQLATGRIKPEEYIGRYLSAQKLGLQGDHRHAIYEQTGKVNFADLEALHHSQLKNKAYTYCVLASENKVSNEELARYGTVKKLSLEELFGY